MSGKEALAVVPLELRFGKFSLDNAALAIENDKRFSPIAMETFKDLCRMGDHMALSSMSQAKAALATIELSSTEANPAQLPETAQDGNLAEELAGALEGALADVELYQAVTNYWREIARQALAKYRESRA